MRMPGKFELKLRVKPPPNAHIAGQVPPNISCSVDVGEESSSRSAHSRSSAAPTVCVIADTSTDQTGDEGMRVLALIAQSSPSVD
jgi:hypothetical protein